MIKKLASGLFMMTIEEALINQFRRYSKPYDLDSDFGQFILHSLYLDNNQANVDSAFVEENDGLISLWIPEKETKFYEKEDKTNYDND